MMRIVENDVELSNIIDDFVEIKGVGFFTACTVISNMPDPDVKNFSNAKEFAAFIGVTPSEFESKSSVKRKTRISKIGATNVRKTLYMASISMKNRNEYFPDFVKRLENKGKCAKIIIVAIMRKLMHIFLECLKLNQNLNKY